MLDSKHMIWRRIENATLEDIALRMGRAARWAGATDKWWSVLDHSLLCYEWASYKYGSLQVNLGALLHDCHEFATADIPKPFKCDCMINLQAHLDTIIWRKLDISPPDKKTRKYVDVVDREVLDFEEKVFITKQIEMPRHFDHLLARSELDTINRDGKTVQYYVQLVRDHIELINGHRTYGVV